MARSDTAVVPAAWAVAAGLLAPVAAGAAAAVEADAVDVAVLELLELLEQAAAARPIAATPAATVKRFLMVMLP
jgi:hypothetical protein